MSLKETSGCSFDEMESENVNGSRILYTTEFIDAAQAVLPAIILTLLIFSEIALALFTVAYVKNLTNKSFEHMQSMNEKLLDVENIQQINQTVTDAARRDTQEFDEGIRRTSETLMSNQILFKLLMNEEINRETMRMINDKLN
ncbi:Uncharacterized protein BM_BM1638 [Brugia malayi]|uniref:Bm1638 n=1 Tax=Brugia malayi TaxID=6279 RepID=A0A0J9Y520_BRUMA|nr:Uncharacterized protein BM_BM1638 [Brugia malayi]CDQ02486.1 Bm1638 [Brugia malayi]VIO96504.1 Uncharacterized protein BM_BM1638 [Brugia malayi]